MTRVKPIFLLTAVILITESCGVLTKSQAKRSINYFETVTNHTSVVRRTAEGLAIIELESQTLNGALKESNQERIDVVIQALTDYEAAISPSQLTERSLLYIEQYIQGYYLLATNGYDKYSQLKSASGAISPIGGVALALESLIRRKNTGIKTNKRDDLQRLLKNSHDSVQHHIGVIRSYLNNDIIAAVNSIEVASKKQFEDLLQSIKEDNEPIHFYQNYNRDLSRFYQKLYLLQNSVVHLEKSLEYFSLAEMELLEAVETRQKIETESKLVNSLLREIEKSKALLARLNAVN